MMKERKVKIDFSDLEKRKTKIAVNVGVSAKSSLITDDSNISGWKNKIDACLEADDIRKGLLYSENLHLDNIEEFKETWFEVDSTLADDMKKEYE